MQRIVDVINAQQVTIARLTQIPIPSINKAASQDQYALLQDLKDSLYAVSGPIYQE